MCSGIVTKTPKISRGVSQLIGESILQGFINNEELQTEGLGPPDAPAPNWVHRWVLCKSCSMLPMNPPPHPLPLSLAFCAPRWSRGGKDPGTIQRWSLTVTCLRVPSEHHFNLTRPIKFPNGVTADRSDIKNHVSRQRHWRTVTRSSRPLGAKAFIRERRTLDKCNKLLAVFQDGFSPASRFHLLKRSH